MTVRCPECSATLRVKQERIGNRTHGTCPTCRASVPLKASEERIQVQCTQCNTMLKAPASSAGMQGRCPKCRAAIAIGRPAFQEAQIHEADSSVSTQRISVRALGIETMGLSASLGEAAASVAAGAGKSAAHHTTAGKGTATSLLELPPSALTTAAEGIKAAAKGIAPTPSQAAHHASAKKSETHAATPPRTLAEILEQRERAHDEQLASAPSAKAFSTLQGVLCGATAGAVVGTLWAVLRSRFDAQVIDTFVATPPAFASGFGLSDGIVGIALAIVLGAAIGLMMSWTEPPRASARPGPRFVRCVAFGFGLGIVMAALWFFNSGNPANVGGLTPAFNWVRDMMVTGILTGALLHLFTPSKA